MNSGLHPWAFFARQRAPAWLCPLWFLLQISFGPADAAPATPVVPARDETVYRYVIAVDQASSMKSRMESVRRSVLDLFAGGLSDLARPGDVIGFWTFRDKVNTRAMLPQIWVSSAREALSMQADAVLRKGRLSGNTQISMLLTELSAAAQRSGALTAVIITDGSSPFKGTPFDDRINSIFAEHAASMKSIKRPFAIALLSRSGEWVAWAASAGGGRIDIPFPADEGPLPARGAQQALFNQSNLPANGNKAIPKATNTPPRTVAAAPATPAQGLPNPNVQNSPETSPQPKPAQVPAPVPQPAAHPTPPSAPTASTATTAAPTIAAIEQAAPPSAPSSNSQPPPLQQPSTVSPAPAAPASAGATPSPKSELSVPPPVAPPIVAAPTPEQKPVPAPPAEQTPVVAVAPPPAPTPANGPKLAGPIPPKDDAKPNPPAPPIRDDDLQSAPVPTPAVAGPVSPEEGHGDNPLAATLAPAPRAWLLILGLLLFVVAALLALLLMRSRRPPPSASFISQSLDRDTH